MDAFDPGNSFVDWLTYITVSFALDYEFQPPFRLACKDANQLLVMEATVDIVDSRIREKKLWSGRGPFYFPIRCDLVDVNGRSLSNDTADKLQY